MWLVSNLLTQHSRKKEIMQWLNDNFTEPNKITLFGWVDKALDQTLTKKNIISKFRVT
jgi:hypothetical protein